MGVNTAMDYSFKAQVLLSSMITVNCSRLSICIWHLPLKKKSGLCNCAAKSNNISKIGAESAKCKIEFTSKLILSECVRADFS